MKKEINSLQNSNIKNVVRLRTSRGRKVNNLTIVEGWNEVSKALEAKVEFKEVYICNKYLNKYADAKAVVNKFLLLKVNIYEVSEEVFQKMSFGNRKEGILAVCQLKFFTFEDLKIKSNPFYLVLEGVEKPGNLGAIFRTCDGADVDGVIICDGCSDIYNPNVIRASIATVFSMKFIISSNEEAYDFLKLNNIMTYASLPDAKDIYFKKDFKGASAIVLGNEHSGLSDFWKKKADAKIRIPMSGIADSLNVSSSAAILTYEILRQRNSK